MNKKELYTYGKKMMKDNEYLYHQLNKFQHVNKSLVHSLKFILEKIHIPFDVVECDDEPEEPTPENNDNIEVQ